MSCLCLGLSAQAVGVVTGGIAEMFLSWKKERIVAPRPNFAKLALQVRQMIRHLHAFKTKLEVWNIDKSMKVLIPHSLVLEDCV